ncbi:MAG: hypothetical protein ACI8PD_001737 [Nitrospinales bacterium]|jgi:hypothetical protein
MKSDNTDLASWDEKELKLINYVEVFQAKPAILKKVESRLVALQKSLEEEINPTTLPQGVDLTRNQIARGENHNGFPYLSLDYPQNFSKTEMFTFRTLFWWGHYLGFSLILKGEHLEDYADRLLENWNTESFKNIYVSLAPNPFEWEINKTNFSLTSQSTPNDLHKTILELDYLKIIRVFPVTNENFITLNWTQAGLQFWKDLSPVTLGK